MFTPARPTSERIARLRAEQGALPFSYAHIGSTRGDVPPGMQRDESSTVLGAGDAAWDRARAAVRAWRMFDFDWVELHDPGTPVETGRTVVVVVRSLGLWSMNAARIAYVVDEPRCFGFAYATLPEHAECGEELFLVTRDASGSVEYRITADSRPQQIAARIGSPWVRVLQKRFARQSLEAMRSATSAVRG